MKICDWCSENFEPNVNYQIYCCSDCRESATKEKVNERYQQKKRKELAKKERHCANGCGTILSIYNDSGLCGSCVINEKQVNSALKELKGLIDYEKL